MEEPKVDRPYEESGKPNPDPEELDNKSVPSKSPQTWGEWFTSGEPSRACVTRFRIGGTLPSLSRNVTSATPRVPPPPPPPPAHPTRSPFSPPGIDSTVPICAAAFWSTEEWLADFCGLNNNKYEWIMRHRLFYENEEEAVYAMEDDEYRAQK